MEGQAPTTQSYLTWNVNSAMIENPYIKQREGQFFSLESLL